MIFSFAFALAFALLFCALMWPLQVRFARRTNRLAAALGAATCIFCAFAVLGVAFLECALEARRDAPQYLDALRLEYSALQNWGAPRGIELPIAPEVRVALGEKIVALRSNAKHLFALTIWTILICAFVLSQFDVRRLQRGDNSRKTGAARVLARLSRAAENFHDFLAARVFRALFAGASTLLFLKFVGVDFSFSWSTLAALLVFVPIFGAPLAATLPALWAWLQFQSAGVAILVFIGGVLIQILAREISRKKTSSFFPAHVEAVGHR